MSEHLRSATIHRYVLTLSFLVFVIACTLVVVTLFQRLDVNQKLLQKNQALLIENSALLRAAKR